MKVLLIYAAVIGIAVVGLNYYFQTQNFYGDISVEESRRLIKENPSLVVVDVRTPSEYKSSHIEGSVNFCYSCDPSSLLNNLRNDQVILVYCETGVRSSLALGFLKDNGYIKVYNMIGGITAWKTAGYPIAEG